MVESIRVRVGKRDVTTEEMIARKKDSDGIFLLGINHSKKATCLRRLGVRGDM